MALNIYTSNRMENLVTALADVVSRPLPEPMQPEMIVVQSRGMQRWLSMELAGRFGVWANCDYPFPNDMVWRLFGMLLPDMVAGSVFLPEVMTWKILGLLPRFLDAGPFALLRRYLEGDVNGLKRFQLAEKIADSFDQYTLFRPEMLLAWEAGEGRGEEEWQAMLWRELARDGSGRHRARLKEEYCRGAASALPSGGGFPGRIALFGISYLPNYHMEVLSATAAVMEVNLFLLSPTREYWSDIISRRAMARLAPGKRAARMEGNPLLASLGKLGRDFSDTALEVGELAALQKDLYEDPGDATMLRAIQSGILSLSDAGEGAGKRQVDDHDRSVQIHSCHSPLREIEVLHDHLLDLMSRSPDLEPRQIVVMAPDIELYAPYVVTVFEGGRNPSDRIPFSIADRNLTDEGEVARAALKLLELSGSRLSVVQLLDILETAPVSRRFGLSEEELQTIRTWLVDTRVRWGLDERDRIRIGLPAYRDHTWRAGLERLLLGYAMPEEGGRLFNGLLPYDGVEGADAGTLGKLMDFVGRVAGLVDKLEHPHTLEGWRDCLQAMLADFMAVGDETARELELLAEVVAGLSGMGELSGYGDPVEPAVIRSWFSSRLRREQKGLGFMTGGVTFCAMLPMRSIPFRVVALIGMSDGAFPRQWRSPAFDLIARNPRRGDRSLRDEDRYLFLESILAARECLYISYVGQSIRDNSEIPPSVLVSEFLDSMAREFVSTDGRPMERRLVTRHRLQPFSRDYFTEGSPLFSYSEENCAELAGRGSPPSPSGFMTVPLPEPPEEWRNVSLEKLIRFFRNPARFFLENRLGIRLEDAAAQLDEREPFALDGLELYSLKTELVEVLLRGEEPSEFYHVAAGRGLLPPARHGRTVFSETVQAVEIFAGKLRETIGANSPLPRLDFELPLGRFRLGGHLEGIWPERMVNYRCAKMKAKDRIRAWLEHLVLNALQPEGYPRETLLIMDDGTSSFKPLDAAGSVLSTLLDLFWQGLSTPLCFFPASSMGYAHKLEWNLERALGAWESRYGGAGGEGDDPAFRLCFGKCCPFDAEFERISRLVLEPLIRHQV